jgi:hypothetical protein
MYRPVSIALVFLSIGLAGSVSAQQAAPTPNNSAGANIPTTVEPTVQQERAAAPAQATQTAGASLTGLRAGVHTRETARDNRAAAVAAANANLGSSKAMMGVGVAALIVGAIIGGTPGTIIMIGGAVVGLKGLYDYLQ